VTAAFLGVALTGLAAPALGYEVNIRGVRVIDPWTPATLRLAIGNTVYLTLVNETGAPLHLTGVRTAVAREGALHHNLIDAGNVVRMFRLAEVAIAPGETLKLAPQEMHVMLTDLAAALTEGRTFPLTLLFREVGEITVEVMVEPATAQAPRQRP
jgi:copper(I)-binding protein